MQFSAGTQTYNIGGLAGSRALSLSSGTLAIGGNDLSTTYSGTIFARAFVKSGTGTLTLTSGSALRATTSSATLRIAAGSIAAANENALADVVVDMSVSDTGSISWVIPGTTIARLGGIQGQRSIDCNGLAMIIGNLTSTTFAGSLVNCVAVTKVGTGTLALSGINDFSAGIAINAGSLAAAGPRSIGTAGPITFAGGTLAYASGNTTDYSARFSTSPNQSYRIDTGIQTVRFDTPLTSSGGVLVKAGSGTLILNSSSPLMQATISQGTLQFGPTGAINSGSAAIINNGTLEFNRVEPLVQSGLIGGTGGVSVGSGSVSLKAANSFSGVTRVIGGTLSLDHSHALGLSTLDMAGGDRGTVIFGIGSIATYTIGGLQGSRDLSVGANSLSLGGNSISTTYSGAISGSGQVTKDGLGTLSLTGSNSHSGGTTVEDGTLLVNGFSSGAGSVDVLSGATLGGGGIVGGATTISNQATLAPGNVGPGTLGFLAGVTWQAGSSYNWQISNATGTAGMGTEWDAIATLDSLTIAATSSDPIRLNLWSLTTGVPGTSGSVANFVPSERYRWTIATAAGGISGFEADKFVINTSATNGTGGFANALDGGTFSLAQSGNDLNLVFTAGDPPSVITINVASGTQTQSQTGYSLLSGTVPVVKTGGGMLVVDQSNPLAGSTMVQQGMLHLANASALSASRLAVIAGGTGQVAPYTTTSVAGLDLATGNGLMDVTSGGLTIASGLSAPQLVAELLEGRGNGSWNGTSGITSSTAAADIALGVRRSVGWLDNGGGSLSVAYAAPGDTNIDWSIDILDAANFLALGKFDTGEPATWLEGDFNYDGIVDILDAAEFSSTGLFDSGNYNTPPGMAGGVAAVPEPAGWPLLAAAIAALSTVRHRRRMTRAD
jgi:autotransporter-associated beta strand protein